MAMRWRFATLGVLATAGLLALVTPVSACSRTTDCLLGDRTYRIVLPTGHAAGQPLGAMIFAHGHGGSADGTMRNDQLVALADELGLAIVAANADRAGWQLPGTPSLPAADGQATLAYVDALRLALIDRFAVAPERIVIAGFSSGGMLVWHVACHRGGDYAGFIALSGTFWEPLPHDCPTMAVDLVHYHGTTDTVVPLEGRSIRDSRQGNVFAAMALFRAAGGFGQPRSRLDDDRRCEVSTNEAGNRLELCLFDGGHIYRTADLVRALRAFGLLRDQPKSGD